MLQYMTMHLSGSLGRSAVADVCAANTVRRQHGAVPFARKHITGVTKSRGRDKIIDRKSLHCSLLCDLARVARSFRRTLLYHTSRHCICYEEGHL